MSLLMDALKKAEQEKKEAAKRLKETETPMNRTGEQNREQSGESQDTSSEEATGPHSLDHESPTMELSLAPIEQRRQRERSHDDELTPEEDPGEDRAQPFERDEDESAGEEEAAGADSLHLELDRPGIDETGEQEVDEDESLTDRADSLLAEEMDREGSEADPDQTFHGTDMDISMERARYEETVREEVQTGDRNRYDETLPGVSALQMSADIGGEDQPTPVAAETIFTAGTTTRERSPVIKWFMIGTTVVMTLAAAVWYYYTVTPINRELPSPMVARGVERTPPEPSETQVPQTVIQSGTLGVGETAGPEAQPETTATTDDPAGKTSPENIADDTAAAVAEKPAAPQTPPEKEAPSQTAMESGGPEQATPAAGDDAPAPAADEGSGLEAAVAAVDEPEQQARTRLPEAIEPPPSMIRISRSKAPEQQGVLLKEAYRSYKSGNYPAAAEGYEKVLNQYPDNRDALLGQAAVALKQDDIERALRIYARLLQLNPRDNLARAALINLSKGTDMRRSESTIKLMLQDNPELPYLHFALGNVYASQSRWPDAQQAFFDAYRLDSANADYAANLAVSLDHMGKSDSALDYYRTALELAGGNEAGFDPSSLKTRIATLEGTGQP